VTKVSSHNDWSRLREIVVGRAAGCTLPPLDVSLRHFFRPPPEAANENVNASWLQRISDETDEDLGGLADILRQADVLVRRPDPFDHSLPLQVAGWETTMMHALMPRDCLLVVGSTIIEAPMPVRSRYCETFPFRGLLKEYFDEDCRWVGAPKPALRHGTYRFPEDGPLLGEDEPLFDAANIIRCGEDLFYNVSNTGNRTGAEWLRRVLGAPYRVHEMSICDDHVGTTIQLLRPGLLLANASRLAPATIPDALRSWKQIWFGDPVDDGYAFDWPRASVWVGMNVLSIDEEIVMVPAAQIDLMRKLEKAGLTVAPVPYRHGRTFGGGLHCCTLDIRREGLLESYL